MKKRIFISSVQKELAGERRALKSYILGDALLGRFFDVFLFEDMPAADRRADKVYLDQVDRCDVYLGLLGNEYGCEDDQGVSPTEREFDRAAAARKQRLIFVKGENDAARHPKMQALVRKAGGQLIRRRFNSIAELTDAVYASLVNHLEQAGIIQNRPFDEQPCPDASLDEIARGALADFIRTARAERRFPLAARTPAADVLEHLHLLADGGQPTRAAVLLFGKNPQRFIPCAEIRCMHFHGAEIVRPAPFYRIFKGPLFSQVDEASNFVLSVTNVSVGTRSLGPQAPVRLEIPRDVIQEAIVNAVVHRDYTSNAAIQVAVFSDRVEIWNPGELLPPLTPDSLRVPHRSITRNHRICESMFLAGYIEKYGTGTLMMIRESVEHALPEPIFKQSGGEFVAVVGRDWLTEELLATLNLHERQFRAVMHVKLHGYITNSAYRGIAGISESTALRDLKSLADMGLLEKTEGTGRNARYELVRGKPFTNPSSPSLSPEAKTRHKPVKPVTKDDRSGTSKAAGGDIAIPAVTASGGSASMTDRAGRDRCTGRRAAQLAAQVGTKSTLSRHQVEILCNCRSDSTLVKLMAVTGRSDRTKFRHQVLNPLLERGLIEMTIPDKPTSRQQKYRRTDKGTRYVLCKGAGNVPIVPSPAARPDKKIAKRTATSKRKSKGSSK